jgi:hypothetical protein
MSISAKPKKYVADPNMKIQGGAMRAFLLSSLSDDIKPHFAEVMQSYGYSLEINDEYWYPLQAYYDLCKKVEEEGSNALTLISIGRAVIEAAQFPPEIDSIPSAIRLLMDIHHLNLQNVPEDDGYSDLEMGDQVIKLTDNTGFPHDVIYGYLYGLANRFKPEGYAVIIEREYLDKDEPNNAGARYTITWEK